MFPEQTVHRVRFIKRAQELGFSLAEIRDLLSIQVDPKKQCSDVKRLAKAKIVDIEEKIRTLDAMKRVRSDSVREDGAANKHRPTPSRAVYLPEGAILVTVIVFPSVATSPVNWTFAPALATSAAKF